jgi:SAP domain
LTLYARSDVMSTSIPAASGGCGSSHTRPVRSGSPDRVFRLDCPPCESYLKGERKGRILKTTPGDSKAGIPAKQERVADADPLWSSTPDSVPLTPDELSVNAVRTERGAMQIQMLQALAAIRATGVDVPAEAMWLLERDLPAGVLHGTMLCASGHDNPAGVKFCGECGTTMSAQAAIETIPLATLHPQTLRKKCRERGLPDKGSKDQLIARLEAA